MAQKNDKFSAYWLDTSTAPWTPLTGLSATITIMKTNWVVVVDDQPMTELGRGWYIYTFAGYSPSEDYLYSCNPWATAYIESWVTGNTEQLISEIRTSGGGGINYWTINNHTSSKFTELERKIESAKIETLGSISETNSHIDIAKWEINDKIDSIEIPEAKLEEKEAKKAIKLIQGVDKKLTSYIDSEMKEKEEMSQIMQEFTRQEIEDIKAEKEKAEKEKMDKEEEQKELEEIKAEFERQEQMEKEEKKKELEKELKATLKEAEELKKELNSIK